MLNTVVWVRSYLADSVTAFSLPLAGSYLPGGYPFSPYGSKIVGGEEGSDKSRASPTVNKTATDSKALDILHQHASQYKSKSPTVGDKPLHDRDREQDRGAGGDRDRERERERERDMDRPRSSPSQRIMSAHPHLGYPLLSGQYDLSYATGQLALALPSSSVCRWAQNKKCYNVLTYIMQLFTGAAV